MRQFYLQELVDTKKKENEANKKGSKPTSGTTPRPPQPHR